MVTYRFCIVLGLNNVTSSVDTILGKVAIEMIHEAIKYNFEVKEMTKDQLLRAISASRVADIDIAMALGVIQSLTGCSQVLVNLDEANGLVKDELVKILQSFGTCLCDGLPVLFSISGLRDTKIFEAVNKSSMKTKVILLSPLKEEHCVTIIKHVLPAFDVNCGNVFFKYLLLLMGGVPRYLQYLLNAVHLLVPPDATREIMAAYLANLNAESIQTVLTSFFDMANFLVDSARPEVFSELISLSVAEAPAGDYLDGVILTSGLTIAEAMSKQFLFLGKTGVYIPPVLLSRYVSKVGSDKCSVVLLRRLDGVMTSRENETLYVSVICHRMRTQALISLSNTVSLSTLLGIELENDVMVKIQPCTYKCSDTRISGALFIETVLLNNNDNETLGFVNKGEAAFADGWITFNVASDDSKFFVYIQEKQSSVTRSKVLQGGKPPSNITRYMVKQEYTKVKSGNRILTNDNHLFIYVSDDELKTDWKPIANVVCVTNSMQKKAFGVLVSSLKAHATSCSSLDTVSDNKKQQGVVSKKRCVAAEANDQIPERRLRSRCPL